MLSEPLYLGQNEDCMVETNQKYFRRTAGVRGLTATKKREAQVASSSID